MNVIISYIRLKKTQTQAFNEFIQIVKYFSYIRNKLIIITKVVRNAYSSANYLQFIIEYFAVNVGDNDSKNVPPMTSGIICKLVRVPAGFELVFWLLFLKATGGGAVLMLKIYSRVYFEKQKLIFFFYRKVISLNYCLLQILKKNILFIHFESHKYLTGKRDYDKSPLYDRCSWKLHWKKNILFIHIVCV